MSNAYMKLVDYAETLVGLANNKYKAGNQMGYFALLSGIGAYKVESFPGAGHNYQAVIDAIHKFAKRTADKTVQEGYQQALDNMTRIITDFSALQKLVNILAYERKLEVSGQAAFCVEMEMITFRLHLVIEENRAKFETENTDFSNWLERLRAESPQIVHS